jgi:steroid delta-isomerase
MSDQIALERLVRFYETIDPRTLRAAIGTVYAEGARFKDPFNDVAGLEPIAGIFAHMFEQVDEPRFVVTARLLQGSQAFLTWEFRFRMKRFSRAPQTIHGATHIQFDASGLVTLHRDYWDAAEELYEKLPVLGTLMRWLKARARD